MKTNEIRDRFLSFFEERGHRIVKSDSLIPQGDPSLLFTGAGMNPFKDYFLGIKKDLKRACSSQKCLRTGDLDRVGQTAYHHSFFEMLGNFSFGDYFKKESIGWAWEFLTKTLAIPREKLRVSVHRTDDESFKIWRDEVGVPESLIARLGDDTNFWPANAPTDGPNGPCGPCSEIFFDQGDKYPGADPKLHWIEDSSGRFAEIWNLVFTQFDRQSDGSLKPLAAKNIDTGAGLERIACVLQGKRSNFEIDIFEPILANLRKSLSEVTTEQLPNLYAIADHVRAVTFAISDGAFPSNEGRGYVIRKLIRRSVWRGRSLGCAGPFLNRTVPTVMQVMSQAYPEIRQSEKNVIEVIRQEEERFLETLDKGLGLLEKLLEKSRRESKQKLAGDDVFLLYDTYGFPDELTKSIAQANGLEIEQQEFDRLMEAQRQRAKEKSKMSDSIFMINESKKEISHLPSTRFLGYEKTESAAAVLWFKQTDQNCIVALDQSVFYPEQGGQVADQGTISCSEFELRVSDVQKTDQVILHLGTLVRGTPKAGLNVHAAIDVDRRRATMRNHTATHLLQAALRGFLGKHVRQVGSLVSPSKLRFDFTHGSALGPEEILRIENEVNLMILSNRPVQVRTEDYRKAAEEGAIAFFGDKYDNVVRVVDVSGFSTELCGGTHCERSGDIGCFVIASETAIAAGTRRIEALTGISALQYLQDLRRQVKTASELLKTTPDQLSERIEKQILQLKNLEKGGKAALVQSKMDVEQIIQTATRIGKWHLITATFPEAGVEQLRKACDDIRRAAKKEAVVLLFGVKDQQISLVIGLTPDLKSSKLDAGVIAKELSFICEGSGGGRKDFAQGGGKKPAAISKALEHAVKILSDNPVG